MKLELLKVSSIPHVTSLCHNNSTLRSHKYSQWQYLLHTEIKSLSCTYFEYQSNSKTYFHFLSELVHFGHIIYICLAFCLITLPYSILQIINLYLIRVFNYLSHTFS